MEVVVMHSCIICHKMQKDELITLLARPYSLCAIETHNALN